MKEKVGMEFLLDTIYKTYITRNDWNVNCRVVIEKRKLMSIRNGGI